VTRPRTLASSPQPLAEMLIDSLRASGKLSRLRDLLPGDEDHDDEHHQLSLELEDESNEKDARWAPRILHPDEAAAAVFSGRHSNARATCLPS